MFFCNQYTLKKKVLESYILSTKFIIKVRLSLSEHVILMAVSTETVFLFMSSCGSVPFSELRRECENSVEQKNLRANSPT